MQLELGTGSAVQALVRVGGNGTRRPRCLLLHGNPGSLEDWQEIVPRLSGVADVLAIDLPGFGRSPRPGSEVESLSLDRMAAHVVAAADALSWHEPFFVVGHSHGGGIAQTVAARYPQRVAGLVLIATLGAAPHHSYRLLSLPGAARFAQALGWALRSGRLRPLHRGIVRRVLRDLFWPEPVPAEKVEAELERLCARPEILVSMVQVALGRPCEQLLASACDIHCATLFLHGREDMLAPVRCAEAIHERILNAGGRSRFQLLPGAGHKLLQYQASELADSILSSLVP
jgi:pimeloyl-ACP methyl ester carboxylesterase